MGFRRTNPLALAILIYLGERPRHPYEIAADMRIRQQHDTIKLNYGSLYSVIAALEKQGLITAGETTRAGRRPERTIYSITDRGRDEALDWLAELLSAPVKEYLGFEAALSLVAALPPDEVAALLRKRLVAIDQDVHARRALLDARRPDQLPRLFILEAEYRYALLTAERQFIADLLAEIDGGTLEGLERWRQWTKPDDLGKPVIH